MKSSRAPLSICLVALLLCIGGCTADASALSARARTLVSSRLGEAASVEGWHSKTKRHGCKNDYRCPAYSKRKEGRSCYDSFDDCYCISGYEKVGYTCQPVCANEIQCPAHSAPKNGVRCVDHISKCECKHGYEPTYASRVYSAVLEPIVGSDSGVFGEVNVIALGGSDSGLVMYSGAATGLEENLVSLAKSGSNCTARNACGVHIHSGDACTDAAAQGGHLFSEEVEVDPWLDAIYDITDSAGNTAFLGERVIGTEIDVNGKPFIVHDNAGSRVACGILRPVQNGHDERFKCQPICYDDFVCPVNSFQKANRICYDSFDDCECEPGFEKKHGECKPICYNDFHCPAHSYRKHNRKCYDSFDDCECEHGFEKKHGECKPICYNDFHCPSHSYRKHNRKCYDSFDDCECEHGFEKKHGECKPICYNDFHCPAHSFRKDKRKCYDSFDDCECEYGFEKKHGKCVLENKYNCFTRESWSHDKKRWCCTFKNLGCGSFHLRH